MAGLEFKPDVVTLSLRFNIFNPAVATILRFVLPSLRFTMDSSILGTVTVLTAGKEVEMKSPDPNLQGKCFCYKGNGLEACFKVREECVKSCQHIVVKQERANNVKARSSTIGQRLFMERELGNSGHQG